MTPEEINVAIAESCGWTECYQCDPSMTICKGKPPREDEFDDLPKYYGDLNEISEAIHSLDNAEMSKLLHILSNKVLPQKPTGRLQDILPMCAKAPQLCEAYLRMKGLWKE